MVISGIRVTSHTSQFVYDFGKDAVIRRAAESGNQEFLQLLESVFSVQSKSKKVRREYLEEIRRILFFLLNNDIGTSYGIAFVLDGKKTEAFNGGIKVQVNDKNLSFWPRGVLGVMVRVMRIRPDGTGEIESESFLKEGSFDTSSHGNLFIVAKKSKNIAPNELIKLEKFCASLEEEDIFIEPI